MVYSLGSFKAGHREESEILGAQLGASQVHTEGKQRWSLASSIPSCPLDTLDMWAWAGVPAHSCSVDRDLNPALSVSPELQLAKPTNPQFVTLA